MSNRRQPGTRPSRRRPAGDSRSTPPARPAGAPRPPTPARPRASRGRAGPDRALLLEAIHPAAGEILAAGGFRVEREAPALSGPALAERLRGIKVLGIRSKTRVAEKILSGTDLWAVGCFCIGTNQVDLDEARGRGIPVFNAPFSNTRSVAEMVLSEMIALARQLGERTREVHAGEWRKAAHGCHEVRGRTVGIIGYGHIGSQVGVLAEAVGMRVLYHDIARKLPMGNNRAIPSLAELLAHSDFVTLHVPATPRTRGMMGPAEFSRMRRGSYLLNASRGDVVQIPALVGAIRSGHLAGAAVDVFPEEPEGDSRGFRSELQGLPNVILTPHIGGSTEEAQEAIGREVATSLLHFVREGATPMAVNFPHVELPAVAGSRRILNVHHNVPGVMGAINRIVSEHGANIDRQILSTDGTIGYLIMDLGGDPARRAPRNSGDLALRVAGDIGRLETSIRTRSL